MGVAVSGGADSTALLSILDQLRGELGITLSVLHLNHQLRSAESDADEAFVRALAQKCGLQLFSARKDVAAEAKQHGWNLEDAGRRLRYEFFAQLAREGCATKIATAHTADDQAETVLARIFRGSGLKGLASIQPKMSNIVRPLLEVRRQELREYLTEKGQSWREDASNQDVARFRARLRHRLLPQLEEEFSPAIVERLCSLSGLARDENAFWSALIQDRFANLVVKSPSGLAIRVNDLLSPMQLASSAGDNPAAVVTQKLIRHMHSKIAQTEGQISRRDVERVTALAGRSRSGRHLELPCGVRVNKEFDKLIFRRKSAAAPKSKGARNSSELLRYEYEVHLPSSGLTTISIPELGGSLCLKLVDWPMRERDTSHEHNVLDAERLSSPLVIRNWRPGDAYRPHGRQRQQKLKRMFLAGRVALTERALWPVLTSAGKVAWARRMPVAAEFSANKSTRVGLKILEDV